MKTDIALLPLVRRWWWALLLGAFLAGAAAFLLASKASPTYKAELKLLVGPISADARDLDAAGELGRTYSELIVSRPVLQAAIDNAGAKGLDPERLEERVSATSNEISRIITVGVEHGDPQLAANLANALGRRIMRMSSRSPSQETEAVEDFMRQAEIAALEEGVRQSVETAAKRSFGQSLAGRVQVVDPATKPSMPVGPLVPLMTLLAGLAGLLVAGIVAVLRESSAEALEDEGSIASIEGARFLGVVDAPLSRSAEKALPVWTGPETEAAERYRLLAAKVGFLGVRPPLGSLLVLDSGEGRTSGAVAANLAAVLIEADWRVLLVDANPTGGGLTRLLSLDGQPGYTDLIEMSEHAELNGQVDQLLVSQSDELDVLPSGTPDFLANVDVDRARRILDRLRTAADIVVFSAPPLHRSPAALVWAMVADATLLAAEEGRTSRQHLAEALESLSLVDSNVVGTVLARVKPAGVLGALKSFSPARAGRLRRDRAAVADTDPE